MRSVEQNLRADDGGPAGAASEAARAEINRVIADQTEGKITGLLQPGTITVLTRPTTWAPVTGWGSTPAFTTDDWIVPSARSVDTTTRP